MADAACELCKGSGLVGPRDDQFVCPCPDGRAKEKHYTFNHTEETYVLDEEAYLTDPTIASID